MVPWQPAGAAMAPGVQKPWLKPAATGGLSGGCASSFVPAGSTFTKGIGKGGGTKGKPSWPNWQPQQPQWPWQRPTAWQSWGPPSSGKGGYDGFAKGGYDGFAKGGPYGGFDGYGGNMKGGYGYGGKGYGKARGNPPPPVPDGFLVDPEARYTGIVKMFAKWKGYGFINVASSGVVPNDQVFVHWKSIQSDDRFPFLVKDLEVEFSIEKQRDRRTGNWTLKASNVTMVGGVNVSVQDDMDAAEKQFVGGQHLRYTGTLKFFNPKMGFGFVSMDQGYDVDPNVPTELRVDSMEVNAGGVPPVRMENVSVEFGIWMTQRGQYKVYNMTLPGGHPLTQDALENRISMGGNTFSGEIAIFNWRHGWGFINPGPTVPLPQRVVSKLQQQAQAARSRGKNITSERMLYFRKADCAPGWMPQRGMVVSYSLYIDDKGAGAFDVRG